MKNIRIKKVMKIDERLREECLYNTWLLCRDYDSGINHPHFLEDDFSLYEEQPCLYYAVEVSENKEEMAGHLALYKIDESNLEICLLVRPAYRKQGIMNRLLEELKSDYEGYNFSLPLNEKNESGIEIAKKSGFQYKSTEYRMKLDLENTSFSDAKNIDVKYKNNCFYAYLYGNNIGICKIEEVSEFLVCLYDVQIFSEYRGLGYGYAMLQAVFKELVKTKSQVVLHVTKENNIACGLYKKIGFGIEDSTVYYLFHRR